MPIPIDPAKAAEWFLSQGFKAFPVWGVTPKGACLCPKGAACDNPGKHPATVRGFKDATDDIERVRTFLGNPGTSNYGLVAPKGVIAVDVDGEAGKAEWDHLQHSFGPLPATLTVVTANGWHFIFRVNPDKVTGKLFGFVTRTEGAGYSIGPGSIHASGVTYGLANAKVGIQPLPEAWEKGWEKAKPKSDATQFGPPDPTAVIAGQGRHDFIRDRARSLHGQGLDDEAVWAACLSLNARFAEPLSEERLRQAIGNLDQFPVDPPPIVVQFPKAQELAAQEVQAAQTASLQTLATLPYGTPPSPLVLDTFIAPEGWTVLYANGGTGKGLLALWMMRHVLFEKPESRIAMLDYEGHQWEWGNRARAIGWSQAELERVIYIDPYDPVWKKGHTLSGIAPALRPIGDANDVALYVVDSYTTAAGSDTEMGGVKGAVDFFKAGAALGAPGLVLAHTSAGDGERFPAKPFGSSFVHNLARETWAGAQLSSEQGVTVPGLFGVTASSISVELRNKKRSVGGRTSASQVFDIEFRSNGAIRIDYRQNYERPVRDLILDVLSGASKPMSAKQLMAAIKEDTERVVDETTINRTITRGIDGVVTSDDRPKTYAIERASL